MRRSARFIALLLVGLGLLATLGYFVLARTTRTWFETDLSLRSQLAVRSARESLSRHWRSDRAKLTETLTDITRDERVMAAAACSPSDDLLAATPTFPAEFSCRSVQDRMRREVGGDADSWSMSPELPSGSVELSVVQVNDRGTLLGSALLVQDLSYLERREATTRNFLFVAFFVLSLAAALVTLVAARFAWRSP